MTTLKDKELDITISKLFAIDDFDNIETSGFETKDVKEAVLDISFLIDYQYVYSENSDYEDRENYQYFELLDKYNLNKDTEYDNQELIDAVFGDFEK